ncbi:hypothetical protein Leryth_020455 [Lithospermum erythrorhizon]|nr:hypothetical protein Leryth_020455 [Lithospermum erythrorhizon]
MKTTHLLQTIIFFFYLPSLISSQTCKNTCGTIPIKYPFGTGSGCGDPRFQPYVYCENGQLNFKTHTGCYQVTSIDYNKNVMYISDTSMSTCACWQPSKGFSLDWNAPFSFQDDTIFALLDCSVDSSPIYKSSGGENNSSFPMCDNQGAEICSLLYSCQAVSRIDLPVSTCCVYAPVDLGPSFDMDLQKLKCTSYSSIHGFNGQFPNPQGWNYGISLKYKFNFNNDYPIVCDNCEKSHGVCGYNGPYNAFSCNCPTGVNTTTDCYLGPVWNNSIQIISGKIRPFFIFFMAWFFIVALM